MEQFDYNELFCAKNDLNSKELHILFYWLSIWCAAIPKACADIH